MELVELRKIFKEHKYSLIQRYDAEGASISVDGKGYHIMIYLARPPRLDETLAAEWQGIRLVFKETGKFKTQGFT